MVKRREHPPGEPLPEDRRLPSPQRLHPNHPGYEAIVEAHERAMASGQELYPDPITGLWAMTAQGLWDRGYCCDTGCRHCPYVER